jgi:hypothetical protein
VLIDSDADVVIDVLPDALPVDLIRFGGRFS